MGAMIEIIKTSQEYIYTCLHTQKYCNHKAKFVKLTEECFTKECKIPKRIVPTALSVMNTILLDLEDT